MQAHLLTDLLLALRPVLSASCLLDLSIVLVLPLRGAFNHAPNGDEDEEDGLVRKRSVDSYPKHEGTVLDGVMIKNRSRNVDGGADNEDDDRGLGFSIIIIVAE